MRTSDEQRKHERFVPEGSAFVVFRPEFRKIGPINGISRGGLGCSYLCPVDEGSPLAERRQMVDILLSRDSFYIPDIPCSPVYDDRENNGDESFMRNLTPFTSKRQPGCLSKRSILVRRFCGGDPAIGAQLNRAPSRTFKRRRVPHR